MRLAIAYPCIGPALNARRTMRYSVPGRKSEPEESSRSPMSRLYLVRTSVSISALPPANGLIAVALDASADSVQIASLPLQETGALRSRHGVVYVIALFCESHGPEDRDPPVVV